MDLATLIGLILGIIAVFVGMVVKGAALSNLINPAAFLIIILGTIAAVTIAFPLDRLKTVPKLLGKIFTNKKSGMSNKEIIDLIYEWAQESRKNGLLALESKIQEANNDFLARLMKLAVDGVDEELIRDLAETEISAMEDRHAKGALVFTQAGTYAPTLGVLGAVIGLIAALGNLSDVGKLGHAIAGAFVATLLGIFTGYVLWHPFANKLKQKSQEEIFQMEMILEGVLMIQSGAYSGIIKTKLLSMLSQQERDVIEGNTSKGKGSKGKKEKGDK